jgi:hypothetical protein
MMMMVTLLEQQPVRYSVLFFCQRFWSHIAYDLFHLLMCLSRVWLGGKVDDTRAWTGVHGMLARWRKRQAFTLRPQSLLISQLFWMSPLVAEYFPHQYIPYFNFVLNGMFCKCLHMSQGCLAFELESWLGWNRVEVMKK